MPECRRSLCTLDGIIDLTFWIEKHKVNHRFLAALLLGVKSAFDSVSHHAVLSVPT